jgi:hypothetical protein
MGKNIVKKNRRAIQGLPSGRGIESPLKVGKEENRVKWRKIEQRRAKKSLYNKIGLC